MIKQSSQPIGRERGGFDRGFRQEVRRHYQALLAQLDWPGSNGTHWLQTLGVTSCAVGEGVSTVAAQLAAAAALQGDRRVLLVDANLARPTLQQTFGVDLQPGLADSVLSAGRLAEAIQPSSVSNLSILTAGKSGDDPTSATPLTRAAKLLGQLPQRFDLTVLDLPEARSSAVLRTAALLDGVLLVVEAERTPREAARRTTELLSRAGARVLGVVLNHRCQD